MITASAGIAALRISANMRFGPPTMTSEESRVIHERKQKE
jgi:hypothetical protein